MGPAHSGSGRFLGWSRRVATNGDTNYNQLLSKVLAVRFQGLTFWLLLTLLRSRMMGFRSAVELKDKSRTEPVKLLMMLKVEAAAIAAATLSATMVD